MDKIVINNCKLKDKGGPLCLTCPNGKYCEQYEKYRKKMLTIKTKYLLLPTWKIHLRDKDDKISDLKHDIPPYFIKLFDSKKEIEEYLNSNNIQQQLHKIMCDKLFDKDKCKTEEDAKKQLKRSFDYHDITFWVIGINPLEKENRRGIMQHEYDNKTKSLKWKYRPFFGGKVWKDELLFGVY